MFEYRRYDIYYPLFIETSFISNHENILVIKCCSSTPDSRNTLQTDPGDKYLPYLIYSTIFQKDRCIKPMALFSFYLLPCNGLKSIAIKLN